MADNRGDATGEQEAGGAAAAVNVRSTPSKRPVTPPTTSHATSRRLRSLQRKHLSELQLQTRLGFLERRLDELGLKLTGLSGDDLLTKPVSEWPADALNDADPLSSPPPSQDLTNELYRILSEVQRVRALVAMQNLHFAFLDEKYQSTRGKDSKNNIEGHAEAPRPTPLEIAALEQRKLSVIPRLSGGVIDFFGNQNRDATAARRVIRALGASLDDVEAAKEEEEGEEEQQLLGENRRLSTAGGAAQSNMTDAAAAVLEDAAARRRARVLQREGQRLGLIQPDHDDAGGSINPPSPPKTISSPEVPTKSRTDDTSTASPANDPSPPSPAKTAPPPLSAKISPTGGRVPPKWPAQVASLSWFAFHLQQYMRTRRLAYSVALGVFVVLLSQLIAHVFKGGEDIKLVSSTGAIELRQYYSLSWVGILLFTLSELHIQAMSLRMMNFGNLLNLGILLPILHLVLQVISPLRLTVVVFVLAALYVIVNVPPASERAAGRQSSSRAQGTGNGSPVGSDWQQTPSLWSETIRRMGPSLLMGAEILIASFSSAKNYLSDYAVFRVSSSFTIVAITLGRRLLLPGL